METDSVVTPEATDTAAAVYGAKVTADEIRPFAKTKCKWCFGSGTLTRVFSPFQNGVVTKLGRIRKEVVCGCAGQRFLKANRDRLIGAEDGVYWKPEFKAAPAPAPDTTTPSNG